MKENFLVTPHPKARITGATRLFVTDPYVTHILERNGELLRYEEVITAAPLRTTREIFQRDHEFVDRKYHEHVEILFRRLNEIHGTRHDQLFWKKSMALALLRHITLCYDLFQFCEQYLDPKKHDCRILAESSFFTPKDFNEHRRFFEQSDFGHEQLFSVYCRIFHPSQFHEWSHPHDWPDGQMRRVSGVAFLSWLSRLPRRAARWLLRLRSPKVAVIRSYFSEEYFDRLLFKSRGLIQFIQMPEGVVANKAFDDYSRDKICRDDPRFDRFDRFAFAALRHGIPRMFVEDFLPNCERYRTFLGRFPRLSWIVCEAWIGDAESALLLALARDANIRHMCNEHNYLAYPFLGNNLKYIIPLVDQYATIGWNDQVTSNCVAAASLFFWKPPKATLRDIPILLVASIATAHPPEINASYGEAGSRNAKSYFEFMRSFFSNIPSRIMKNLLYRAYPNDFSRNVLHYDERQTLGSCIEQATYNDALKSQARSLMARSRLVIVNYLSTAYLEALIFDVPTVVLWNRETYYLDNAYTDLFDELVAVGIFQDNPVRAAQFVTTISETPEAWWGRPEVRHARERFLERNIGDPERLIQLIMEKV